MSREMLLQHPKEKGFLHQIITVDKKWIFYKSFKRKQYCSYSGQSLPLTSTSTQKRAAGRMLYSSTVKVKQEEYSSFSSMTMLGQPSRIWPRTSWALLPHPPYSQISCHLTSICSHDLFEQRFQSSDHSELFAER